MTKLTIEDLTQFARQFLRDEYGLSLEIPIKRNNRLRRTMGWFVTDYKRKQALYIELSGELLTYAHESIVVDTLKHELIHYALFEQGRKYRDGQDDFENELKRLGVSSNSDKSVKYGVYNVYVCLSCMKPIETKNKRMLKSNALGYRSNCCKANLRYLMDVTHDGVNKGVGAK